MRRLLKRLVTDQIAGGFRFFDRGRLLVAAYHGVTADTPRPGSILNYDGKHVALEKFERHLRFFKKHYDVIALSDIETAGKTSRTSPLLLTFDDGYRNVYTSALAVLRRESVRAAVFLPVAYIGSDRLIWSDALECSVERIARSSIALDMRQQRVTFASGSRQEKIDCVIQLKMRLRMAPRALREEVLCQLEEYADPSLPRSELHALLTWDEVRGLVSAGCAVGSHAGTHVALCGLSPDALARETAATRRRLEQESGCAVTAFSYPYGAHDEGVVNAVRAAGYQWAFTTEYGLHSRSADRLRVRRIPVANTFSDTFLRVFMIPRLYAVAGWVWRHL